MGKQIYSREKIRENPFLAATWIYTIYKADDRTAMLILKQLNAGNLRCLIKNIKIPLIIDKKNQAKTLKKIFQNPDVSALLRKSNNVRQGPLGIQASVPAKSKEYNWTVVLFIVFSILIFLFLILVKDSEYVLGLMGSARDRVWISLLGLLVLMPFFIGLSAGKRYFSKLDNPAMSLFASLISALLLIGLLALLNYREKAGSVLVLRKEFPLALILLFTCILGPWIEEILFRGLLFDFVISFFMEGDKFTDKGESKEAVISDYKKVFSLPLAHVVTAFIFSSAAFASVHSWQDILGFLIYFLCGLILVYQRYIFGSLWPAFISHGLANAVILLI